MSTKLFRLARNAPLWGMEKTPLSVSVSCKLFLESVWTEFFHLDQLSLPSIFHEGLI